MLDQITPLILTLNEEPNLARALAHLSWAKSIVVVDSGSVDRTQEIARLDPRVRLFVRPFTTHAEQWNFGLEQTGITSPWVLALDADFVLTSSVRDEIAVKQPDAAIAGYLASFDYCVDGKPLRSGVYPAVTVLFRRGAGRYQQDGHTQRIVLDGVIEPLAHRLQHDDRKPLSQWIGSQVRYMQLETDKLVAAPAGSLGTADRIRKMIVVAPVGVFVYCLLVRGGVFDGWRGWYYAMQRTIAESILSLMLLDRAVRR